ncbi:MAG: SWIM zinc finger family protein [Kibdelosporangium sp.]
MTGVAQAYRYIRSSELHAGLLGLQTSGGTALHRPAPNPLFFKGFLTEPAAAAAGLHSVAKVAASRYFQPTQVRLRDPVVTCNGDRLRFESFASCCGVYARLDVLSAGLDGEVLDRGTTNVDVNEPLRRMLARVGSGDPLRLAVGPDDVTVTTLDGSAVEKKVELPPRWLRGFAELQVITAGMEPRAELPVAEAARFLRSLSSTSRSRGAAWAVPAGRSLRLSARPAAGAVCLAGPQRLEALTTLLRHARSLRAYGPVVNSGSLPCASAWELALPGMTFVLVLSPEVNRGFSGEGAVLDFLAGDQVPEDAELIGGLLEFEPRVEPDLLSERSGLPRDRVRAALVQLGVSGRVGYDLAEAAYFHRELPYDAESVEQFNPRLRDARALIEAGAVTGEGDLLTVKGYQVRFTGGDVSCTCAWWLDYRGTRGKCKHVLAAEIFRGKRA